MNHLDYIRSARAVAGFDRDHSARHVLLTVATYCNDDGDAWPHLDTLAADTGLAVSNVKRALYRLRAAGLTWTRTRRGNIYHLQHLTAGPRYVIARPRAVTHSESAGTRPHNSDSAGARPKTARGRAVKERVGAPSSEVTRSVKEVVGARELGEVADYYPPPDPDSPYALAARPIPAESGPAPITAHVDPDTLVRMGPLLLDRWARLNAHIVTPAADPDPDPGGADHARSES